MEYNKYEIVKCLLFEGWWSGTSKEEDEHIKQQKAREKEWAEKGSAAGTLAGISAGTGYVAHGLYKQGLTRNSQADVLIGLGLSFIGSGLGKSIGWLVARMTRAGYKKPEINQAVEELKSRAAKKGITK
jgi:hypothetical protein